MLMRVVDGDRSFWAGVASVVKRIASHCPSKRIAIASIPYQSYAISQKVV